MGRMACEEDNMCSAEASSTLPYKKRSKRMTGRTLGMKTAPPMHQGAQSAIAVIHWKSRTISESLGAK